jgi:hypothetical protein
MWLKQYSPCFTIVKSQVQTPAHQKKKKSTKGCIPKHHIHQPTTTLPLTPSSLSIPLAYVVPLFTGLPVLSADFIMIDEDLLFLHHYSLFLVSSLLYIVKLSHGLL